MFRAIAQANNWRREEWAQALCTLLTGKALDVYSRLSDEDSGTGWNSKIPGGYNNQGSQKIFETSLSYI